MKQVLSLASGVVQIRKLQTEDFARLRCFLSELDKETHSRFAPHPFDESSLRSICERADTDETVRILALNQQEDVVAYFLLQPGLIWHDADRLPRYGLNTESHRYGTIAPCVAAGYRGSGLAQQLLVCAEEHALQIGLNRLILWGGVQQSNSRAVTFYEKCGFHAVGEFEYNGANLDMVKDL